MRRGNIFWGMALIVLGALFFLQARGLVTDVLGWFWPVLLIMLGAWVMAGRFLTRAPDSGETFSIDLQGAAKLDLDFDHGAGSVVFTGGAPAGVAITGSQALGMDVSSQLSGDSLGVDLNAGPTFIPFLGPESGEWRFQVTQEVPVAIKVDAGASSLDFDMTDIRLTYLGVDTGASMLKVKLPVNAGHTLVNVESGAATVDMIVPEGVAARIRLEQGVSSTKIDEKRFPLLTAMGNLYQSPDFDSAANKVEINLEGGANSVQIR
ncbi:MAG: hypothetical protein NT121_11890 [Chloroflexi bacterium]|nr:hypothetical protein [Chloroflexota bacterium]